MPRKPLTIPKLIKKLDRLYSLYQRHNYSIDGEHVACFTCGVVKPIKEMHNGHYIPRTESPTRFSQTRPQCPYCNTFRSGMPHEFRRNLCLEIGEDAVEALEEESRKPWKWSRDWLEDQIAFYQDELRAMNVRF